MTKPKIEPDDDYESPEKERLEIENLKVRNELDRLRVAKMQREDRREGANLFDARLIDFAEVVNEQTVHWAIRIIGSMAAVSKDPITVRLNSPGGYVTDGLAFYDFLRSVREDGVEVRTLAVGMVASMATVVFQAGTNRVITPNSFLLIHEASAMLAGKTSEMEEATQIHKILQSRTLEILAERSTFTTTGISRKWKKKEWMISPSDAVEYGFADEVGYK